MSKQTVLFIVEGENRDYRFINEMTQCFFKGKYKIKIISLAASQNIYMLYQKLLEDDFDTDVVEILREQVKSAAEQLKGVNRQEISEVYMFFDYDIQEQNISNELNISADQVIEDMLEFFDNETENGKLFISYPMVEALYDYQAGLCECFTDCYVRYDMLSNYKHMSGYNNPNASIHYKIEQWKMVINVYILRLQCLMSVDRIDFEWFRKNLNSKTIYLSQKELMDQRQVLFVLSAFPEFLLYYFKRDFWNSMVKYNNQKYIHCSKKISPS